MAEAPAFVGLLQCNKLPRRRFMGKRLGIVRKLGCGSFGEVLLVEDRQAKGAVAVVKRSHALGAGGWNDTVTLEQQVRGAMSEALIMAKFDDDGIVRLMDFWYEEHDGGVCFLMEYCDGGDLEVYLQRAYPLGEQVLLSLFLQCLLALALLHAKEVVHRDLKLSNILLNWREGSSSSLPTLKLADFGLSLFPGEGATMGVPMCIGTPLYMSPETIIEGFCGYCSDVWSLGVVFYRMMTNCQPFAGSDFRALQHSIVSADPPHPCMRSPVRYSRGLGDLVMGMLSKDPRMRPCARRLIASPLFSQILLQCPWRSRPLRGTLCLFVCRSNCTLEIFAKPRKNAKVLATLRFADHIFLATETFTRATSPGGHTLFDFSRIELPEVSRRSFSRDDSVVVWCRVLGPHKGYCVGYEQGHGLLRHVSDWRPCSPLPAAHVQGESDGSFPEPVRPMGPSNSPPREKVHSSSVGKILSAIFSQCSG